jgi:hypothetical protein
MSSTHPTDPTASVPIEYPEITEADGEAMFASVVWFRTQPAGTFDQYEGKYVAIMGEQILDADSNQDELVRRLDEMGDTLPPNRVVIQYVYRLEDLVNYSSPVLGGPNPQEVQTELTCDPIMSNALSVEPSASVLTEYPEITEADGEAMFASVVWFDKQQSTGVLQRYEGKYVAILGEQIVDADTNEVDLFRRIDAMGDRIPPNRLVVRYVPRIEELNW